MTTKNLSLRPYQVSMIDDALEALSCEDTALCIAPTGAGKTVILSQIMKGYLKSGQGRSSSRKKILVLQHTKELLQQNRDKVALWCPKIKTSLFHSEEKDTQGRIVFAMVQTLSRHYRKFPKVDLVVIDEAHHAIAKSYLTIVNHLKAKNPDVKILGMTATPNRGDRKGLKSLFKSVTSQIHLSDLMSDGYLVSPRIFTVDAGQQKDLRSILWTQDNSDGQSRFINQQQQWDKANTILTDNLSLNEEVIRHWQEKAQGKKTVVFCSTLYHAQEIRDTFEKNGIGATHINGEMSSEERLESLRRFDLNQGDPHEATVITNAAVLTEGWDFPAIECVILLRPMSYEATYVQMIGRGLRSSPGKKECIVLDFGMSSSRHKVFGMETDLVGKTDKEKPVVEDIFSFEEDPLDDGFVPSYSAPIPLKEIAPHLQSPYLWEAFESRTGTEVLMAGGYNQTAFIIKQPEDHTHISLVKSGQDIQLLKTGSLPEVLCACEKTMREMDFWKSPALWMSKSPSEKQWACLAGAYHYTRPRNSYQATLLVSLNLNKRKIQEATKCQIRL
ncbi:DEAD/DEAH box helicase [Candidatus Finniella inopinata]|uniref:DEAD/DEAH box helicase n=1 Tax=Candidatus Finniella inopinata TaxID=1696036 RepID=A0A4Q7DKC3_9PROT|nr:DEAD/DEAH box helicase [Candidatus Finniella inopinata]RZI45116.1 DEAD/DEAH box helicase [Candidatus Finniella inopinata]